MDNKTTKIREMAKEKSTKRQEEVLSVIKKMEKDGEKITFYSVIKATGASKSYLYGNEAIYAAITKARDASTQPRSQESTAAIISSLKLKIKKLEKENAALRGDDNSYDEKIMKLQAKIDKLEEENSDLKTQLRKSYDY